MSKILKTCVATSILIFSNNLMAKKVNMDAVHTMEIKLVNLETELSKERIKLVTRKEHLNEMKLKMLVAKGIDKKKLQLELAELEVKLAKDNILLSHKEVKLHEMKVEVFKYKM